jgi:hypothetical protein
LLLACLFGAFHYITSNHFNFFYHVAHSPVLLANIPFWRTFLFGEHSFLANIPFWRTFLFGEHSFLANIPFWRTFSIDDVVNKIEMVLNGVGYGTLKQQEAISINQ